MEAVNQRNPRDGNKMKFHNLIRIERLPFRMSGGMARCSVPMVQQTRVVMSRKNRRFRVEKIKKQRNRNRKSDQKEPWNFSRGWKTCTLLIRLDSRFERISRHCVAPKMLNKNGSPATAWTTESGFKSKFRLNDAFSQNPAKTSVELHQNLTRIIFHGFR